jgi:hypothetical protein
MKRFVAALGEQLSLTSEEIADILWLAVQMGELPQPATSDSSQSLETGKPRSPQQIDPPLPKDPIDLPNTETPPPPAEIHIPEGSNLGGGLAISVPDARSLREPLELARSLKPLLQRVASGWSNVLDEEATILKIDRDRVWMPVLKPNLEAWLDLVLVVDESVSMQIWQRTISELQRFLAHYGVFRDVRVYSLVVENERAYVRPRLGAASQGQSLRNPQELIDPSGRRLILVATDCVSAFWRSGEVLPALKLWAKSGPMAIVQMLPEWLWGRSGLGLASSVRFAALQAGIPNHQLQATNLSLWDDVDLDLGIKVPVVTLEPAPMKTWAQLVAGKGGIQSPGFVFDPEPLSTAGEEQSRTEGLFVSAGSGEERVRRFQVTASPMARQLAMILAAAPTISLPIVRILQDRLLPRSQQVHVAEVFLGGLLKPLLAVDPQSNPDLVPYEFMDGARDVLFKSVRTTDAVNVLQEVSQFVAERLGLTLDAFMGVLRNPQETGDLDVVSQSRPFALMTAQILRKLGGNYTQFAQELEQANRQDSSGSDSNKVKKSKLRANPGGQIGHNNLIGRDRLIAELWHILDRQSLILTGDRRMGKTSIVKQMTAQPLPNKPAKYQDLEGIRTPLEFVESVFKSVEYDLNSSDRNMIITAIGQLHGNDIKEFKLPILLEPDWKNILIRTIECLMTHQDSIIVFFWDEIPMMLNNIKENSGETVMVEILNVLRLLRHTHNNLRMVFTGDYGLHHILYRVSDSKVTLNDMHTLEIPPIDFSDAVLLAHELLLGENIGSEDLLGVAQSIARSVDNIPFYIHHVVLRLKQMTPPIDHQSVLDVIQNNLCAPINNWNMSHYLERINHYYDSLIVPLAFGILDELAINAPLTFENLLTRLQQDSNFQTQNRETVKEVLVLLEQDSYLRRIFQKDSITYTFRFPLIQQYWLLNRG